MGSPEPPTRPARRRRRSLFAAAAVGLLAITAAACRVPSRYDAAVVIDGLKSPWDLSFVPDGSSFFFTERTGDLNWGTTDGQRLVIGHPADVVAQGEGGLMGIAVDRGFDSNRRIYACYMTANDVRVVRFQVDGRLQVDAGTPIVTGIQRSTSGRHSGCRVRIGPDGYIYVTTGDAARATNPQDLNVLNGKVLRVNTSGDPVRADGNPYGSNMANGTSVIFAYGFRNPQGISWRPSDGQPFLVEHGADRDDEITPIVAGGNGGWNPGPGYNESVPMTNFALGDNVMAPQWTSGFPTIAPSGGTFVTSELWGDRAGQMAMAVLKGQQLRMINLNPGVVEAGGAAISNLGRIRVAVESPFDGRLYVLTDSPSGQIIQITPVI